MIISSYYEGIKTMSALKSDTKMQRCPLSSLSHKSAISNVVTFICSRLKNGKWDSGKKRKGWKMCLSIWTDFKVISLFIPFLHLLFKSSISLSSDKKHSTKTKNNPLPRVLHVNPCLIFMRFRCFLLEEECSTADNHFNLPSSLIQSH